MKPHKHAELIKAWADGAEIQFLDSEGFWRDCCTDESPDWNVNLEYRIKPEEKKPVVRWKWVYEAGGIYWETEIFYSEEEKKSQDTRSNWTKLEYTRTEFPK